MKGKSLILLVFLSFIISCDFMPQEMEEAKGTGRLILNLDLPEGTLREEIEVFQVSAYLNGVLKDKRSTQGDSLQYDALSAGNWLFAVIAENQQGVSQAEGALQITIASDDSLQESTVALVSPETPGGLIVDYQWNNDDVVNPGVSFTLINTQNETIPLAGLTEEGAFTCTISDIDPGEYTLKGALSVYDGGSDTDVVVSGFSDKVRIFPGFSLSIRGEFSPILRLGEMITVRSNQLTILWDYNGDTPEYFQLYYRDRSVNSWEWTELTQTLHGEITEITIEEGIHLSYGLYELAVEAVSAEEISELHSSLDTEATPITGWYVNWTGP